MRLPALAILLSATLNMHAQWEIQDSHTTASLRGIHNVGRGIAWASGTGGTVLRTTDDGKTWQTCPVPLAGTKDTAEKLDFRGIQAFDAQTAIVMSSGPGDQSRLYKTTDGCQTWKLFFTNPDKDGFWDALVANGQHLHKGKPMQINGRILGDPVGGRFCIYDFFDGYSESAVRKPWHHTQLDRNSDPSLTADPASSGAFAASNSAYLSIPWKAMDGKDARNGTAWATANLFVTGGSRGAQIYTALPIDGDVWEPSKWRVTPLLLGSHTQSLGAFAVVAAQDRPAAVIVGGDYLKPDSNTNNAAYFSKIGDAWLPAQTPPHGYRSAVAYDPNKKTWITVGPNGTDISTDDGRNWRALTPSSLDEKDADKNWNALSLPFVVGPKGRIGKLRANALTSTELPAKAKP